MKDEEKPAEQPKKGNEVGEMMVFLRGWAQTEVEKDRQVEIDALLSDAGVKPQPDEPANPS